MTNAQMKILIKKHNELIAKSFDSFKRNNNTKGFAYRMQAVEMLQTLEILGYKAIWDYENVRITYIYKVA